MPIDINPLFQNAINGGINEWLSPNTYFISVAYCRFAIINALRKCGVTFRVTNDIIVIE